MGRSPALTSLWSALSLVTLNQDPAEETGFDRLHRFQEETLKANRAGAMTHAEAVRLATSLQRFPVKETTLELGHGACDS